MTTTSPASALDTSDGTGRARWARLASFALLLAAIGPVTMLAGALIWGLDIGDDAGFFGVAIGVAALGAFLFQRPKVWARVLAIVLSLLMGAMLFWTAFSLGTVNSVFDFLPGLVVLPGVLLAVGAGIAAVRAERRGDVVAGGGSGETRVITVIAAVVAGLAVVSAVLTVVSRETVDDPSVAAISVTASDFEFDRERYAVDAGDQILLTNDDPFFHTFTVDGLDIDVALTPGSQKLVTVPEGSAGSYVVYCAPHTSDPDEPGEHDMAAELVVG